MHLPAEQFTACATAKWPSNTLFPDVDATSTGFADLQRYLALVLALYDLSPCGILTHFTCMQIVCHGISLLMWYMHSGCSHLQTRLICFTTGVCFLEIEHIEGMFCLHPPRFGTFHLHLCFTYHSKNNQKHTPTRSTAQANLLVDFWSGSS